MAPTEPRSPDVGEPAGALVGGLAGALCGAATGELVAPTASFPMSVAAAVVSAVALYAFAVRKRNAMLTYYVWLAASCVSALFWVEIHLPGLGFPGSPLHLAFYSLRANVSETPVRVVFSVEGAGKIADDQAVEERLRRAPGVGVHEAEPRRAQRGWA